MELLFFSILALIFFGIFGDGKKQKGTSKANSVLSPNGGRTNYPSDWENYEAAEQSAQAGMQEDIDPRALFKMSKERVNRAKKMSRKAAAAKLSYTGLPTSDNTPQSSDNLQSFETTAKSTQTSSGFVAKQPPLIRDMNLSRKLFLSGGRGNTFGERQKKSFGLKGILGTFGLGVIALYLIGVLGS